MDAIAKVTDREISKVIDPSVAAFAPLLRKQKEVIRGVSKKTFQYGPTERHQLDVYYPKEIQSEKTPVLFYVYGGGYSTGDRSLSPATFGLVYNNIGAFYTQRGFIVIIADYRLVPNVTFPGPAEDLRDAISWTVENSHELISPTSLEPDLNSILIMGHSAGSTHIATMLLHPDVLTGKFDNIRSRIKGAVLVSGPHDKSSVVPPTADGHVYTQYWGLIEAAHANDPLHLYRAASADVVDNLPKILLVEGEFEPDWILDGQMVFQDAMKERIGKAAKKITAIGHNHISIIWAVGTGQGEEWAEQVVEWYNSLPASPVSKQ